MRWERWAKEVVITAGGMAAEALEDDLELY
jgi:hypothetical protein